MVTVKEIVIKTISIGLMDDCRLMISVEASSLFGSTNFDLHADASGISLPRSLYPSLPVSNSSIDCIGMYIGGPDKLRILLS